MKYVPPIGGAADDPYIDANPGIGQDGSAVPAAAIEAPQREIQNVIEEAGLTPDDEDYTQLAAAIAALIAAGTPAGVAYLAQVQAWTKAQRYTPVALVDGASIAWNLDDAPMAKVTLGGNRTMAAPTNQRDGGMFVLEVTQDGTGGRTLAWNVAFEFGLEGTPVQPTAAGKKTIYVFLSDGAAMRCVGRWEN